MALTNDGTEVEYINIAFFGDRGEGRSEGNGVHTIAR